MDSGNQQQGENGGAPLQDDVAQPTPSQPSYQPPPLSQPSFPPLEVHPPIEPPPTRWPGQVKWEGKSFAPAGFWLRTLAFVIDMVLLTLLHVILVEVAQVPKPDLDAMLTAMAALFDEMISSGLPSDQTMAMLDELQRPVVFSGWLRVAMCATYFTMFHGLMGQSLGKLCVGIRVLTKDGKPLNIGQAALRYLGYFLTSRLLHTAWIVPFDNQRRTLYDMALGTNVYREISGK